MKLDPSEMFKVLGVDTRVRIIELLKSKGPLGAKNIAELVGITPAAVSQHLKILRQSGLVRSERNCKGSNRNVRSSGRGMIA